MIHRLRRLPTVVRTLRAAKALESHDRWSPEQVRTDQRERLLAIIRHAASKSPYYRESLAGIELSDDLDPCALPRLDKRTMLENFDELVTDRHLTLAGSERHLKDLESADSHSDPLLLGEYRAVASGGTSGRRGVFVYNRADWEESLAGVARCWSSYFNSTPRFPRRRLVALTANHPIHMGGRWNQSLDVGIHRMLRLDARTPVAEMVESLNAFRPESINIYPSIAALLAEQQLSGVLRIEPQAIGTVGEVLTAEMREQITAAWGPVLFDYYGASETGLIAAECDRHTGMHVFEDQVFIEVVDDDYRPVPDGKPGCRLLVTNLFNRTQPLIRYELNDLVTASLDRCPCGRPFPLLKSVEGRSDDVLEMPATDGGTIKVHPLTLRSSVAGVPAVSEFKIAYGAGELHIEAVLDGEGSNEQACREIETRLGTALLEGGAQTPPIHVKSVGAIPRHASSGKHKMVEVKSG